MHPQLKNQLPSEKMLGDLTKVSLPTLYEAQQMAKATLDDFKKYLSALSEEITARVKPDVDAVRLQIGKDDGTQNIERDGLKIKSAITKKVKWDTEKLMQASAALSWPKVKTIFKIEMSIPEKTWSAFDAIDLPPETRALIVDARSVVYDEKITLEKLEA
jgi:hypothetical protein